LLAQERIASGVFDILPPVQQIPYVSALLQSLHDLTTDEALASTAILKKLVLSADVLIQLLNDLAAPLESASSAVRKKQRQEDGVDVDRADLAVLDMTVLIESRMWKKVPAHAGIVAALLNIQSSVLAKKAVVKEGADYLEQEVLGAILALLERIAVS
jgi:U3 small nucleolar RNA-associated protein 10